MQKPIFVMVGPSASGKTTFAAKLAQEEGLRRAVTTTTRRPRAGEVPGVDYYFVSQSAFDLAGMIEHAEYAGNLYGTSKAEAADADLVIMEPIGAKAMRLYCGKQGRPCYLIGIHVSPEQQAQRMAARGDSEADIRRRICSDADRFAGLMGLCDVLIQNDDFSAAYDQLLAYIRRHN